MQIYKFQDVTWRLRNRPDKLRDSLGELNKIIANEAINIACVVTKPDGTVVMVLSDGTMARIGVKNNDIDKLTLHRNSIPGLNNDFILSAAGSEKFIVSIISGARVSVIQLTGFTKENAPLKICLFNNIKNANARRFLNSYALK